MGCFESKPAESDPTNTIRTSPSTRNDEEDEPIPSEPGIDYIFKVVVIGEAAVGKTQNVNRFTHGNFAAHPTSTVAVDFGMAKLLLLSKKNKSMQINNELKSKLKVFELNDDMCFVKKSSVVNTNSRDEEDISDVDSQFSDSDFNKSNIKLQIWDTAGQERYRAVMKAYYRGAVGAIVMFDITRRDSFEALKHWLDEVRVYAKNAIIIVVGNKSDLEHARDVTTEEAQQFCKKENLMYIETSAKSATNVEKLFYSLCNEIYQQRCVKRVP